jgi:hypothetical protein
MTSPVPLTPPSAITLYQSSDGQIQLEVSLDHDTVWLTQRQMALLFETSTDNVSLHLKNIYAEAELDEQATTEDSSAIQSEGQRKVRRKIIWMPLAKRCCAGFRTTPTSGCLLQAYDEV